MYSWPLVSALVLILIGWRSGLVAWPWHFIFQWAGGASAVVIVGVTLVSLKRERSKSPPAGDGDPVMFLAVVATSLMTLSTLLNFVLFVIPGAAK